METKEYKSNSYKPCDCGSDCYMLGQNKNPLQPCWGNVSVIDEIRWGDDWSWFHACQGHSEMYDGFEYEQEKI